MPSNWQCFDNRTSNVQKSKYLVSLLRCLVTIISTSGMVSAGTSIERTELHTAGNFKYINYYYSKVGEGE